MSTIIENSLIDSVPPTCPPSASSPVCPPPSLPCKTAGIALFMGLYAIYNNVYFKKLGVVEGGGYCPKSGGKLKKCVLLPPFHQPPHFHFL